MNGRVYTHRGMKRAALILSNEVRRALGLERAKQLCPGRLRDAESCPISRTVLEGLGPGWKVFSGTDTVEVYNPKREVVVSLPIEGAASTFVWAFDNTEFPELIDGPY